MKISELLRICGVKPDDTAVVRCALGAQSADLQTRLEELTAWYRQSGLPLKRFFNTSGLLYQSLGL